MRTRAHYLSFHWPFVWILISARVPRESSCSEGMPVSHTSNCDPRGIDVEVWRVAHQVLQRDETVVERRRVAVLRQKAVLDGHHYRLQFEREPLTRPVVLLYPLYRVKTIVWKYSICSTSALLLIAWFSGICTRLQQLTTGTSTSTTRRHFMGRKITYRCERMPRCLRG